MIYSWRADIPQRWDSKGVLLALSAECKLLLIVILFSCFGSSFIFCAFQVYLSIFLPITQWYPPHCPYYWQFHRSCLDLISLGVYLYIRHSLETQSYFSPMPYNSNACIFQSVLLVYTNPTILTHEPWDWQQCQARWSQIPVACFCCSLKLETKDNTNNC